MNDTEFFDDMLTLEDREIVGSCKPLPLNESAIVCCLEYNTKFDPFIHEFVLNNNTQYTIKSQYEYNVESMESKYGDFYGPLHVWYNYRNEIYNYFLKRGVDLKNI